MKKYIIPIILSLGSVPISYFLGIFIFYITSWMTIPDSIIPLTISINSLAIILALCESKKDTDLL